MENKKGFTLIELIIVLALLGIVMAMIFSPLILSSTSFNSQNEKTNIISDSRYAMDYLTREIRKSNKIEVINNTIILDSVIYKLEKGSLIKDDKIISRGLDGLDIEKTDDKIEVKIYIKDNKDKVHTLSSIVYIR